VQGNEGQFSVTYFYYIFMFMDFIYANSLILLGMLDGDAVEDIVDELGEDEIMKESGKLFFFLRYLGKE
jgi:hypothetical protein